MGPELTERVGHVLELDRPDLPWANEYTVVVLERNNYGWRCLVLQGGASDTYETGEVVSFSEQSLAKNFKRIA